MEGDPLGEVTPSDVTDEGARNNTAPWPPWHCLPYLVLVKLFSYLGPRERLAAGLMCRSWLDALEAAALWRSVRVLLRPRRQRSPQGGGCAPSWAVGSASAWDEERAAAAVLASRRYAPLVRRLELRWGRPAHGTAPPAATTTTTAIPTLHLLETMCAAGQAGHLQLTYLQLQDFVMSFKCCSNRAHRGQLLATLASFLESQRRLEVLSLENACLGVSESLRLLGAAARCSGRALTDLRLRAAFREWQAPHASPRFARALRRLSPLSSLHLDYPAVSDGTLRLLAECCGPALRLLCVTVRDTDNRQHALSQEAWVQLTAACTHLRVVLNIENLSHHEDIHELLLPGVPLHGFRLYSGRVWDQSRSRAFRSTLRLLSTNYHHSLEMVHLHMKNSRELVDDLLLELLIRCTHLTFFHFDGVLRQMKTVRDICAMRLKTVINFESIHVRPKAVSNAVRTAAKDISAIFRPILAERAVQFQMDVPYR